MHELGLVFEMAKVIEEALADENVEAVDTVVMEIGEISSVVPLSLIHILLCSMPGGTLKRYHTGRIFFSAGPDCR